MADRAAGAGRASKGARAAGRRADAQAGGGWPPSGRRLGSIGRRLPGVGAMGLGRTLAVVLLMTRRRPRTFESKSARRSRCSHQEQ